MAVAKQKYRATLCVIGVQGRVCGIHLKIIFSLIKIFILYLETHSLTKYTKGSDYSGFEIVPQE